jgi:hypothetical protein
LKTSRGKSSSSQNTDDLRRTDNKSSKEAQRKAPFHHLQENKNMKNSKRFRLFVFGLTLLLLPNANLFAQQPQDNKKAEKETKEATKTCPISYKLPPSVSIGNQAFQNFIKVMSLPSGQRQKAFSNLPDEEKAGVFKTQLALQFIRRADLNQDQKNLLLETILKTSAETYDRAAPEKRTKAEQADAMLQEKALAVFAPNEAYLIFAGLNGAKEDVELLQKYENLTSLTTMGKRRQAFRDLSPAERSSLWKTQMIYYLATSKFNKEQQDFILEVISLSTPVAFDFPTIRDGVRNEETKTLDALEEKALTLFSKEEVAAYFMSFGIHKIPASSQNDLISGPNNCDCAWFCFPCEACHAGTGCKRVETGCGWSGGSPCTAGCKLLENCP